MGPRERVERVGGKGKSENGKGEKEMQDERCANVYGAGGEREGSS